MLFWEVFARISSQEEAFALLKGFKVAELGLCCYSVGVGGPELLGHAGCFCELPSESGQEWGPPRLRL